MQINVTTITSPLHVDEVWDQLTDSQKFSLWVAASGLHYSSISNSIKEATIERYKEILA